jgi:hypothetical protein
MLSIPILLKNRPILIQGLISGTLCTILAISLSLFSNHQFQNSFLKQFDFSAIYVSMLYFVPGFLFSIFTFFPINKIINNRVFFKILYILLIGLLYVGIIAFGLSNLFSKSPIWLITSTQSVLGAFAVITLTAFLFRRKLIVAYYLKCFLFAAIAAAIMVLGFKSGIECFAQSLVFAFWQPLIALILDDMFA